MTRAGRSTATPRLRFPEFRDSGAWNTCALKQFAWLVTDRVGPTMCEPYTVKTGVGLVSQQEKFGRSIAGNSFKNYVLLRRDDFAYNKSSTKAFPQGFIARHISEKCAAVPNSIFSCFRIDKKLVDPAYLDSLFSINLHGKWLRRYIAIGARAHGSLSVNDSDLMALPVPLPPGPTSLKEQQKIANCLASLDDVITAQAQKVDSLKAYKRGLMRCLFPQNGATAIPRVRLPDFSGWPPWEGTTLGDIVDFQSGGTPSKSNSEFWNGSLPWVTAKDMKQLLVETTKNRITATALSAGARLVPAGTVLMLVRGMTLLNDVPVCISRHEMSFNQDVKALLPKKTIESRFLLYLLLENRQRLLRMVDLAGHGTGRISTEKLRRLDVMLPQPAEQRAIADYLDSVEAVMTAEAKKLNVLGSHKRVLTQQLFPADQGEL